MTELDLLLAFFYIFVNFLCLHFSLVFCLHYLGEDGIGSPSAIFLISLSGSFFIAACLHPQEFWCVVPGKIVILPPTNNISDQLINCLQFS